MSKKITLVLAVIVFICTSVISYSLFKNTKSSDPADSPLTDKSAANSDQEDISGPKTEACPLNGTLYTIGQRTKWQKRRPLLIAIENHTESRPQSGLSEADVIYEAVAEGGITRFLGAYYCQDAKPVGPVRSARIYFYTLVKGYGDHPLYAHVGGANTPGPADVLGAIQEDGWEAYNDMNQFAVPFPVYYRDYERLPNVATEHTMYSSTTKLWEYAAEERKLTDKNAKGKKWNDGWIPRKFAADAAAGSRGTVAKIDFGFWATGGVDGFNVSYAYDKTTNAYVRSNGGSLHLDKNTSKPLSPKNVVIVFAEETVANDGYEAGQHMLYDIVGTGSGLLFNNGKSQKITWKKPADTDMMRFYDASGQESQLVRGQVFVHILPTGNDVKY